MRIDGKETAKTIFKRLKTRADKLKGEKIFPHLAVILLGDDPSSVSYVNQKEIKGEKIGIKVTVKNISTKTSQSQLIKTIQQFNNDNNIHGVIVQRPLPKHFNNEQINLAIDPNKDVDGFHPNSKFQPPIALAVLRILNYVYKTSPRGWPNGLSRGGFLDWLSSRKIVILGKGETGGKPIINEFKKMGIELKIIDSKTPNPKSITKKADIIISAVGKENIVRPEMIKRGVILISVGLHKEEDGKLHGDYDEEKIKNIASFYTLTPGGVGPVNVAMLLKNVVRS